MQPSAVTNPTNLTASPSQFYTWRNYLCAYEETASSISQDNKKETPDERLAHYLDCLPQGQGIKINGRNVLPYESTSDFVAAIATFITAFLK
jgi:hypothetical protein